MFSYGVFFFKDLFQTSDLHWITPVPGIGVYSSLSVWLNYYYTGWILLKKVQEIFFFFFFFACNRNWQCWLTDENVTEVVIVKFSTQVWIKPLRVKLHSMYLWILHVHILTCALCCKWDGSIQALSVVFNCTSGNLIFCHCSKCTGPTDLENM